MNDEIRPLAGGRALSERWLPVLLLLFIGSGSAALIYEIVWFQLLQLVIGSSAVSMAVILGTFMGGMCLGSLLLPRLVSPRHHPLKVYALLELGIGLAALLLLVLIPLVGRLYEAWAGQGAAGFVARGLVAALCLLPPTIAMGATLPAVARWVGLTRTGVSWLGFLYAANTAGAVFGSLLAGFYLLRLFDMATASYVAAGVNGVVALVALALASVVGHGPADVPTADAPPVPARLSETAPVYLAIGLSGFCALAAEVIWTRLLGLMFGGSVYTFSIILAVFLIGIGIGSSIGSVLSRTLVSPRTALGWCQLLVVAGIAWTSTLVARSLPYWPINPSISSSVWFTFQLDFFRAFCAVLPATILWGASFPLAIAALAAEGQDPGRLVGRVYAANTVGAVAGALAASLVLVVWIGTQHAQQLMMGVSALGALLLLVPPTRPEARSPRLSEAVALITLLAVAGLSISTVPRIPGLLVAYGRYAATWISLAGNVFYVGEGLNSSVAVSRLSDGSLNYHNAGKIQASSQPQDMRLERMLGHLTTLVPRNPRSVFVIGCGAGVTAGAASIDPRVEHLTIVEIEPLVPQVVATYFGEHNFNVVRNPKVRVHIDDARHYLLTTREKFDAITSDPLDPWVKGAATLYTKEFFELVKQHLNPGGVVTLFVQLYESSPEAVKSEMATFFEVFPTGVIWGNTHQGRGYDTVVMGQASPGPIDVDEIEDRLARPEYAPVAASLREVGIDSAVSLFANYAGRAPDLKVWLRDASINHDSNLRLQYLAGLGLNLYQGDQIYTDLLAYRSYPDGLFAGSPVRLQSLQWGVAAHGPAGGEP
jgi:spermidine synthase